MTAREEILSNIRTALHVPASAPAASHNRIDRAYHRTGHLCREDCMALFLDRLADYEVDVLEVNSPDEIAATIATVLRSANEHKLLASQTFPSDWLPSHVTVTIDDNLSIDSINAAEAVVTTCEAAVASTGTIFLVHEGAQGRRILTLLPDHHICLVRCDQVFELLPEALAYIAPSAMRPITTLSGPSATSDIEMTRIRGVHGPRHLTVILYTNDVLTVPADNKVQNT